MLHESVPGLAFDPPHWLRFVGYVFFLWAFFIFFEGATSSMLDGLLGVPGSASAYSHGPETPLFTEGGYARVRHPQYRSFISGAAASLLIHPNMGQLFWTLLLSATFVGSIPVEEAQLIRAGATTIVNTWSACPGDYSEDFGETRNGNSG